MAKTPKITCIVEKKKEVLEHIQDILESTRKDGSIDKYEASRLLLPMIRYIKIPGFHESFRRYQESHSKD